MEEEARLSEEVERLKKELKERVELGRDINAKFVLAQKELKESEERYRSLIENVPDIVYSLNNKGEFISISGAVGHVLGYSKEELIGMHFSKIIYKEDLDKVMESFKDVSSGSETVRGLEFRVVTKEGKTKWLGLNARSQYDAEGKLVKTEGVARDITEGKKAEEEILQRTEDLNLLNTIIQDITSSLDLKYTLSKVVKNATNLVNGDAGAIALLDEEKGVITYPYFYNMPEKLAEIVVPKGGGLAGHVMETKKSVIIKDYPNHPAAVKGFVEAGLKVLAAVPIMTKGKAIGTLGIFGLTSEKHFSQNDIILLESVGRQAAIAIENAMLYEKTKEFSKTLEEKVKERTKELEDAQKALLSLVEDVAQAKEELEKATIRLQELDQLKSMFIASMSHELRTPLNSIIGFTGILLQGMAGELNDEQRRQLNMVYSSAKHLLALINDVIDLSKIEAGKVEVLIEEVDVGKSMMEVIDIFSSQIQDKGLELKTRIPEDIIIDTDERRFKQVLINFISNAVKFTEKGSIKVEAFTDESKNMLEVRVTDTGIGMKKEDIAKLFKPFTRIESSLSLEAGGTGLGLYLSKKLVTLLGGEISAESEFGKGSTFMFRLPLKSKKGEVK